jgi:hypothetical protein
VPVPVPVSPKKPAELSLSLLRPRTDSRASLTIGNPPILVENLRRFAEDLAAMGQLFEGTCQGESVLVKEMRFVSEDEMHAQRGEVFLHGVALQEYAQAQATGKAGAEMACELPQIFANETYNGVLRLVMKKIDMEPVADETNVKLLLSDIAETNQVTARHAAFAASCGLLRALTETFSILSPALVHGDVNPRNVLVSRRWKVVTLNDGDVLPPLPGTSARKEVVHYQDADTAERAARDAARRGRLVSGPKVVVGAGLVDFGLSRQQTNWLWPPRMGPFEGFWTRHTEPVGREMEMKGFGGWAFQRVSGDFRYCPVVSFIAAEASIQGGPPGFGLVGAEQGQYIHGLDAYGAGCVALEVLMRGLDSLPAHDRQVWDKLLQAWDRYRQLVEHLQTFIRSSNWTALLKEDSVRRVREAVDAVLVAIQRVNATPQEQVLLNVIVRLMTATEPVPWSALAFELSLQYN